MKIQVRLVAALAAWSLAGCVSPHKDAQQFDPRSPDAITATMGKPDFSKVSRRGISRGLLKPSSVKYTLGPGDELDIQLLDSPASFKTTFVMPDGRIYYDLVEGLYVKGMDVSELKEKLTSELSKSYTNPHVRVTLRTVKSRKFWVLGQVETPGIYNLGKPTTVVDAISAAGGLYTSTEGDAKDTANLNGAIFVRNQQSIPIDFDALLTQGDMSQNIYVQPGDYIFVPSGSNQAIYVLGAVKSPQAVPYRPGLSVVSAVATASGPTPKAYGTRAFVVRGSLGKPQVAMFDFRKILQGGSTNFELQPGDIVWIPDSPWKKMEDYLWRIVDTAARTIAINEGALAVDSNADLNTTINIGGGTNSSF